MKLSYCKAQVGVRTIFMDLHPSDLYQMVVVIPIYWEEGAQVFIGEISLEDVERLDIEAQ